MLDMVIFGLDCCELQAFSRLVGLIFVLGWPHSCSKTMSMISAPMISTLCCCGGFYQQSVTSYRSMHIVPITCVIGRPVEWKYAGDKWSTVLNFLYPYLRISPSLWEIYEVYVSQCCTNILYIYQVIFRSHAWLRLKKPLWRRSIRYQCKSKHWIQIVSL